MGTSKGYIAPTTSHWSTAKRAVTAFINNRDFDSKAKAASKYATAMKTDMSTGGSFQSAAARTLGFAQKVASGGLDNALREYNREDLIYFCFEQFSSIMRTTKSISCLGCG